MRLNLVNAMQDIKSDSATTTESAVSIDSTKMTSSDRLKYASERATAITGVKMKELVFSTFCDDSERFMRTTSEKELYNKVRKVMYEYADSDYVCLLVWPHKQYVKRLPYGFVMGNLDMGYNCDMNKPYADLFFDTMTGEMTAENACPASDVHPDIEDQECPDEDKYTCTGSSCKYGTFVMEDDHIAETISKGLSDSWQNFEIAIFSIDEESVPECAFHDF